MALVTLVHLLSKHAIALALVVESDKILTDTPSQGYPVPFIQSSLCLIPMKNCAQYTTLYIFAIQSFPDIVVCSISYYTKKGEILAGYPKKLQILTFIHKMVLTV